MSQLRINRPGEGSAGSLANQYVTLLESADRASARRASANSFFLALNGFLITVVAAEAVSLHMPIMTIFACLLCIIWRKTIVGYRLLNQSKFVILIRMEQELDVNPIEAEWDDLTGQSHHVGLTEIEEMVPIICIALYATLLILNL